MCHKVLCSEESRLFLAFSQKELTSTLSCGQERHLDAELPNDATELESIVDVVHYANTLKMTFFLVAPGPHLRIL